MSPPLKASCCTDLMLRAIKPLSFHPSVTPEQKWWTAYKCICIWCIRKHKHLQKSSFEREWMGQSRLSPSKCNSIQSWISAWSVAWEKSVLLCHLAVGACSCLCRWETVRSLEQHGTGTVAGSCNRGDKGMHQAWSSGPVRNRGHENSSQPPLPLTKHVLRAGHPYIPWFPLGSLTYRCWLVRSASEQGLCISGELPGDTNATDQDYPSTSHFQMWPVAQ